MIFIDVMKDADVAEKYNIEVIPTQVFVDASGKELFRHTGVISKGIFWPNGRNSDLSLRKHQP